MIAGKLLWAFGFNVTEDHVVYFRPQDLVLAQGAVAKDVFGDKHALGRAELDRMLASVEREPDGRLRGLASLWLSGAPLGGPPAEGVRDDDGNDRIPHQLRRDLRGAYAIFAWLEHVDLQESNFLDVWIQDGGRHYVRHYLLDFGKALGVMNTTGLNPRHGREYVVDFVAMLRSLGSLGMARRSWEGRAPSALRGVGMFDADGFDPGAWRQNYPAYLPTLTADRFDTFWAAKILIRFTRAQLHAAVESGRLSDPRAVEYLTDTLVARQRATARYWFARVNPLDRFTAAADASLCFDDLALVYQLGSSADATRYRVTTYDVDGRPLGWTGSTEPGRDGRACTAPLELAVAFGGYTIVRVQTLRPDFAGETFVHIARDPASGAPRVIGIWRS